MILFSTLCLTQAHTFFSTRRLPNLLGMSVAAILAAVSKGNGILIPLIVATAFVLSSLERTRTTPRTSAAAITAPLLLFIALQISTIPFLGPYWSHYQHLGSPFITNFPITPPPALFEPSFARRPGIVSVASGYFTFRIVDLVQQPRVGHELFDDALHRTSLWSQIYGRVHSLHFDNWPRSWQSRLTWTDWITRLIFVLALVPTALLLSALFRAALSEARGTIGWTTDPTDRVDPANPVADHSTVWVVALLGYLAFAVAYSARYRDYSTMKAIFIFPALPALAVLQARGLEWFEEKAAGRPRLRNAVRTAIALLLLLYVCDVSILVYELATG